MQALRASRPIIYHSWFLRYVFIRNAYKRCFQFAIRKDIFFASWFGNLHRVFTACLYIHNYHYRDNSIVLSFTMASFPIFEPVCKILTNFSTKCLHSFYFSKTSLPFISSMFCFDIFEKMLIYGLPNFILHYHLISNSRRKRRHSRFR